MKKIALFLIVTLTIFSCNKMLSDLYGVREINVFDESEVEAFHQKIEHPTINLILDSIDFYELSKIETNELRTNDLTQPIQILYFEENKLSSFHANCYAKAKLNGFLDWNTNNRFDTFIPQSAINPANFEIEWNHYSKKIPKLNSDKKYKVLILWTLMLEKQSNEAINTVTQNLNKFNKQDSINLYLINIDKAFITAK